MTCRSQLFFHHNDGSGGGGSSTQSREQWPTVIHDRRNALGAVADLLTGQSRAARIRELGASLAHGGLAGGGWRPSPGLPPQSPMDPRKPGVHVSADRADVTRRKTRARNGALENKKSK